MRPRLVAAGLLGFIGLFTQAARSDGDKPSAASERGRDAVRGRPALNPPLWSWPAVEQTWKQWGLKEKPADYPRLFRERYGLQAAPYENDGLPMGLHLTRGLLGKGVVTDCLLCHAGTVAGQTIIGAGNASLDLQSLFDDLIAQDSGFWKIPIPASHVRGTLDVHSPVAFLMGMRDAEMNLQRPLKLDYVDHVCSDPPAWWLLKKKKTRNWNGGVDARSVRIDMVNILSPFNTADYIKQQERVFADIHAFIMNVESPRFPFAVNHALAERGRMIFNKTCATCHGTYGPGGKYPNKIVPLEIVGTDPILTSGFTPKNVDYFNKSWLAQEKTPDGEVFRVLDTRGYQAPPLDGIWATAPYFHNGSVPTVYHVLNSKARPKVFTRSYGTARQDYDPIKLGWKIEMLSEAPRSSLPGHERRRIYDTTLPGRGNTGHTFGDDLAEQERLAVIEYLKTL